MEQQLAFDEARDEEMLADLDDGAFENPPMLDMDQHLIEEEKMRAEENIYNTHLDAVKEEV